MDRYQWMDNYGQSDGALLQMLYVCSQSVVLLCIHTEFIKLRWSFTDICVIYICLIFLNNNMTICDCCFYSKNYGQWATVECLHFSLYMTIFYFLQFFVFPAELEKYRTVTLKPLYGCMLKTRILCTVPLNHYTMIRIFSFEKLEDDNV